MAYLTLALEYFRVFTSPQVIGGVVVIVFFRIFKAQLQVMLPNLFLKLPGGSQVGFANSQIERAREALTPNDQPPPTTTELPASLQHISLSPDQLGKIGEVLAAEKSRAALWEYRYLNYFLARSTQVVLDWLASLTMRTTVSMFDSFWLPVIVSAQERQAIINALQAHRLITIAGDLIDVTPKGKEYLQWRGPLPPVPAPPQTLIPPAA